MENAKQTSYHFANNFNFNKKSCPNSKKEIDKMLSTFYFLMIGKDN